MPGPRSDSPAPTDVDPRDYALIKSFGDLLDEKLKPLEGRIRGLETSVEELKRKQLEIAKDYIGKGEHAAREIKQLGEQMRAEVIAISSKIDQLDIDQKAQNSKLSRLSDGVGRTEGQLARLNTSHQTLADAVLKEHQTTRQFREHLLDDLGHSRLSLVPNVKPGGE